MEIARWTTPSITYKPSLVLPANIIEIVMEIEQGTYKIVKRLSDATVSDGRYYWRLTQQETGRLAAGRPCKVKIDYLSDSGDRYTTKDCVVDVLNSAIDEVIT